MQVKRRHIIYVQGYDPRGLAQYYRMFRTELRKFATLYGLTTKVSRPVSDDQSAMASWTIETEANDWSTTTRYDFLRWEDLIQHDMQWPVWRIVFEAVVIYGRLMGSGVLSRFRRANWRFAAFISYPEFMLLVESLVAASCAWLFAEGLRSAAVPAPIATAAAVAFFVAMLGTLLRWLESRTYVLYLMSDTIFTWEFAHRRRADWDARIERFAHYLVDCARNSDAEELVVVGHSSGSFLGFEILSRALEIDADLGRHGPRTILLTLGGNLPIVGFLPASGAFRERLRKLAIEPTISWVDCQSRKDVMNFYPFEPVSGHGIDVGDAQCNPTIMSIRFRDIIGTENYAMFRQKLFRVHFQFVMANERPHPYDFFMIVCGSVALSDRVIEHEAAIAAALPDPNKAIA